MFLLSTLVLCVHTCLTASSVPYAPWLPGHVLPFSVLFHKHTEKSHSSVLWPSTWPAACWLAVELEPLTVTGALTPAFLVPWSRPSRQVGCREQYYCKKTQGQTKSWVAGRGVLIFVSLWFCCGVVLPLLFYFNFGKCWRDEMSCKVHRCPLHRVRRRWLNTDDPAVRVFICKILLPMETLKDYVCGSFYKSTFCTYCVDACTVGPDVQQ